MTSRQKGNSNNNESTKIHGNRKPKRINIVALRVNSLNDLKPKKRLKSLATNKKQNSDTRMAFMPNDLLTEDEIQIKLMNWAGRVKFGDSWLGDYMHHSPNGGLRTKAEAGKFKAMGVKAGYPDIILDIARNGYHGLRIELKVKKGGKASPEQKEWLERLNKQGFKAVLCKGFDEAKQAIIEYMNIGRNAKHDLECDMGGEL